ncbi:unnamed protein product [Symbiodinium natans]|uniref:Uncharacterized protein n=1 Tax=Symbiodinium natans TaxID=878477 RepID=A0A812UA05_9DINO|nr:unnamed protein product [Symbiodinium natans]
MADLTRHLVNDAWGTDCVELPDGESLGIFGGGGSPQMLGTNFNKYCQSVNVANEYTSTGALSVWGWLFTIFFTWSGFAFLLLGICWARCTVDGAGRGGKEGQAGVGRGGD